MFRKLTTAAIAGAMLLSTTGVAFAEDGALAPGEAATVKQAERRDVNPWVPISIGAGGALLVLLLSGSGSSTTATH